MPSTPKEIKIRFKDENKIRFKEENKSEKKIKF